MALSILNHIPSLAAQNQLTLTGSNLQKTLYRLSSGSRINTGADDAAGLAIADGLRSNVSALTQSARNATDGVGKLQVADGALAQVTNLLNRAVTLATESGTGTVSDSQRVALNNEFVSIKLEIDRIGAKTTFNGVQLFNSASAKDKNTLTGAAAGLTAGAPLGTAPNNGTMVLTDADTGKSETIDLTGGTTTAQDIIDAVNNSTNINATASLDSGGHLVITDKNGNGSLMVASESTNMTAAIGVVANPTLADPNKFISANAPGAGALAGGKSLTITDTDTGKSFSFATDGVLKASDLISQINSSTNISATAGLDANGKLVITDNNGNGSLAVVSDITETGGAGG
ncbi:MAG: flagellin, partial [Limisphaerales bacterium]